ncbi:hypothetical protein S40288_10968 [Stachybotrys chartarum IBT 40288]|nr:hypothetical protein S40288_10968 [Stachybotrys chartarum IBT 40288]
MPERLRSLKNAISRHLRGRPSDEHVGHDYRGTVHDAEGSSKLKRDNPHVPTAYSPTSNRRSEIHEKAENAARMPEHGKHQEAEAQASAPVEGYIQHPAIRPLSTEMEPRAPTQKPLPAGMARHRRNSSSSLYCSADEPLTPPRSDAGDLRAGDDAARHRRTSSDRTEDLEGRLQGLDLDTTLDGVTKDAPTDVDYTVHNREPVMHEEVQPHVHTVYNIERTVSVHEHEHKYYIQPVIDPEPTVAPTQHFLEDSTTGEIYRLDGPPVVNEDGQLQCINPATGEKALIGQSHDSPYVA